MGELGHYVGGQRGDQQEVRRIGNLDVARDGVGAFGPEVERDRAAGKHLQRHWGDELGRALGHDHLDLSAVLD